MMAGADAGARGGNRFLTAGGVFGAIAMSSCCIVPLVLFSLGVTSAWIGRLSALYPYKLYIFGLTALFLAGGFYKTYRKPAVTACEPGTYCATPLAGRINKVVLWSATVLVIGAMGFNYVSPVFLGQ